MKIYKLTVSFLICVLLAAAFTASTVLADGETNFETLSSVQFKDYLVLPADLPVPAVTLAYTLSSGEAVAGTATTRAIYAGPDGAVFASNDGVSVEGDKAYVQFTPSDTVTAESSAPSDATIAFATADNQSDEKYAEKTISIDLTGVTFDKIGIYRYVVTQDSSDGCGIVPDTVKTRYVDVYVYKTNEDTYKPGAVIVRTDKGSTDLDGNAASSVKSTGFTNRYAVHTLTLSKTVSGNQASYNQYFRFTVTLTGIVTDGDGDTRIAVTGTYDAEPTDNMATTYNASVMQQANSTDMTVEAGNSYLTLTQFRRGKDFYLHSGQSVILSGIPDGISYVIEEVQEDYSPSVQVTGDSAVASQNQVQDDSLNADAAVAFLNERSGILPTTGVSTELILPVVVILVSLVAVIVIRQRRR